MRFWRLFIVSLLTAFSLPSLASADLFVTGDADFYPVAFRFDAVTGAYEGRFAEGIDGGTEEILGLAFGPDGDLYAAGNSLGMGEVLRYDGTTGDYVGHFVPTADHGFSRPFNITFGPDGNLYVTSNEFASGSQTGILRYNGQTGG